MTTPNDEHWMQNKWRPSMAWTYMAIIIFDFMVAPFLTGMYFAVTMPDIIFPVGTTLAQMKEVMAEYKIPDLEQWQPITLQAGGFFHITMGVVLGISSWTRGNEKVAKVNQTYGPPAL